MLVQNAAASVLTRIRKRDHISPVLASLHWLPVKSRIEFKILLLTFKALKNMAPLADHWLIVIIMADPVSCWHLIVVVDHDQGSSWWWILMAVVDNDWGLWWHPIVMVDPDCGGIWPGTMISTRLLDIQYFSSDTRPLLTIIHQLFYLPLCYKLFILINAANTLIFLMFSITRGIYCTSVRPGRGIPHMWLSLRLYVIFTLFKGFSYSCWGVRAEDVTHEMICEYGLQNKIWLIDLTIKIKLNWIKWQKNMYLEHVCVCVCLRVRACVCVPDVRIFGQESGDFKVQ